MNTRLYGLDHLRALAILLVFFFHYQIPVFGHPAWLTDWAKFGWTGVDLFFVLSGFLISSQLFAAIRNGQRISFPKFFLKRFFRIVPAFLAVIAIYFCIPAFHEREALPPLWRFLTFTQNFGLNLADTGTFSHAWSLCVEEHFYLALPLLLLLFQVTGRFRNAWILLITLFAGGFLIRHYSWDQVYFPHIAEPGARVLWYEYVYYPTYNRLDGLLIGVGIAALMQFAPEWWTRISRYGNYLVLLSLAVLTGAYFLCYNEASYAASVFGFPLVAIGYGLLVMGAISPVCWLYRLESRATTLIATLSYVLYLSHKGVIHVTQEWTTQLGMNVSSNGVLVISLFTCLLAAWILHRFVEQPFMRWRKQLIK